MSLRDYLPIAFMILMASLFAIASFGVSFLFRPRRPTPEKLDPYECGIVPEQEPPERFPVQFFLVAMVFIAFDIEIVFLYPWAVQMRALGLFGVAEMAVFVGLVVVLYCYIRREGVLDWVPKRKVDRDAIMRQIRREADAARSATSPGAPEGSEAA